MNRIRQIFQDLVDFFKKCFSSPRHRIRTAELISVSISILIMAVFAGKYLALPSIDRGYETTKASVTYEAMKSYALEGDILDCNGKIVFGHETSDYDAYADYPENESYAYLLGYYWIQNGYLDKYGLRGELAKYSVFTLDDENKGAVVSLTIDTSLQNLAYSLLNGNEGSVTVIDNKTGAIRCMTSHSTISYNVNNPSAFRTSTVEGSQLRRGTFENDPPGSTFKVVTAASALELAENTVLSDDFFLYHDTGYYYPEGSGHVITNYSQYEETTAYGDVNLKDAMENSINCYFASLGNKVGADQLGKTAKKFLLGKTIQIPFLGKIHSKFDLADADSDAVAQTAFGQGYTEITPVHLCLIAQAIANSGTMMRPYVVDHIDSGDTRVYSFLPRRLSKCISSSVDDKMKELMHAAAVKYGINESQYGKVYAKTGTAQCAGDRIHTYIIGFTEDALFCISMNNGHHSADLYWPAMQLVAQINAIYN